MAETPPWSAPQSVTVANATTPPWSAPSSVVVVAPSSGTPPWSAPSSVSLRAAPGFDWRPLTLSKVRLPQTGGTFVHGRPYQPVSWAVSSLTDVLLEPVFEVAHRGFGKLRPEMTMAAYKNAARLGARSLEVSVVRSQDGYWVCSHDPNTLRATGVSHDIGTTNWIGVLDQLNADWSETDTPADGRVVKLCVLDEVVQAFGRTHVLWIQPKNDAEGNPLVDWINQQAAYIDNQHAVIKLWRGQWPIAEYARTHGGYQSWGIWFPGDAITLMEHFDILGQEFDATTTEWNGLLATGKRVVGHVINTTSERDQALAKGATGLMSMRPIR